MYRRGVDIVDKVAQLAPSYHSALPLLRSQTFADELESLTSNKKQFMFPNLRLPSINEGSTSVVNKTQAAVPFDEDVNVLSFSIITVRD